MAGWQQVPESGFRITVSCRTRWWRVWGWGWGAHIPYFVGQRPQFAFFVEALTNIADDQAHWALRTGDNEVAQGYLTGREGQFRRTAPGKAKGNVQMPMLETSGEYKIVIAGGRSGGPIYANDIARVLIGPSGYSFSVVTREGVVFKLLLPSLFGGAGLLFAGWNLVLSIARGS